ncbi:MAG: Flp pilus assembly protein CpaB, partial [Bdellovibrionales bacterium]|nr:Flp pilus assembly protein CpaB [Bdellovibrionales bacterium]
FLQGGGTKQDVVVEQPPTVVVKEKAPEIKMVDVLIPIQDLPSGQQFEPTFFRVEKRPEVAVDPRIVRSYEQVNGQFAKTLIIAGQPLHADYVTATRPVSAISASIPAGYRAVTINVNATSSVEGWAAPGSKVDVVWSSVVNSKNQITTIVHNAKVLSANRQVAQSNDPAAPVPTTVTLLVTAKDAQKITLATTSGTLALALRGDSDTGKVDYSGSITLDDLLGSSKKPEQEPQTHYNGTVVIDGKSWNVDSFGKLSRSGDS